LITYPHATVELAGAVRRSLRTARVAVGFTIMRGKIVEIDLVADPERLRQLDLVRLDG
jgi:hypothetical protein